jgi:hypothetical protein
MIVSEHEFKQFDGFGELVAYQTQTRPDSIALVHLEGDRLRRVTWRAFSADIDARAEEVAEQLRAAGLEITCTRSGDRYQDQPTDPIGHDWSGTQCRRCGEKRKNPFTDVPAGSFYHDPVIWAVENGITSGTSETTFGPGNPCNRAQVVTFLWSAAGRPEPSSKVNPFQDVPAGCWYEKPVLWALEMGITSGTDATHFSPGASCNRATVVTFLWHAKGDPAAGGTIPFTDVPAKSWYTEPVRWALEQGITSGISATKFGAGSICNRAQVVTFLYKAFA